jgi:predicted Holliday junction resolvase-like endonuclease
VVFLCDEELMILEIFLIALVVGLTISLIYCIIKIQNIKEDNAIKLKASREDAIARSRSVIEGQTFECLAPHFKEWVYGKPSEARFIGSPLDYIIFKGLSDNDVTEIIFLEIKTGNSKVTKRQRSVKKAIEDGKVKYELMEIEELDK